MRKVVSLLVMMLVVCHAIYAEDEDWEGGVEKAGEEFVETRPEFPGGTEILYAYLRTNLKYSTKARKEQVQGRVVTRFIVRKNGDVDSVAILKSVDPRLDEEAMRVVEGMPKWKPATRNGEPKDAKVTMPIVFRLNQNPFRPQYNKPMPGLQQRYKNARGY